MEFAVESSKVVCSGICEKNRIRVLHVDDDAGFLAVAKQCLEETGYFEVDTAGSAEEALYKLKMLDFEAVVADYQMPGMNGLELLRELRREGNDVPFVLFTCKTKEEIAIEALNSGVERYFEKQGHAETTYEELKHSICGAVKNRRAEQALETSEEKYRSLFMNMLNGFAYCQMIWDKNGEPENFVYLEVNDAFEKLTGLKKVDILGKKVTDAIPGIKEAHPELFEVYGRVALTGKNEWFEVYFKPLDIWLSISVYSPKMNYFAAVFDNITERKKAEKTVSESEEKYRRLFEEANDAIFIADAETGIIIDCNRAASELIGREKSELIGMHQRCLHPPEDGQGEFSRTFEEHRTGREGAIVEDQIITKTGEIKDVAIKGNTFEVNGKKMLRGLFRDVTERNKDIKRVRFQADLLNAVGQAVIAADTKGLIIYWNKAAERVYGWSESEMLGANITDTLLREEAKENRQEVLRHLSSGKSWTGEATLLNKEGSLLPVIITTSPILDDEGKLVGILGVSTDISEQKWMQEVFNEAIAKVADLNEKLRVVESLTRHDIRNKLAALNGGIFLLKKRSAYNEDAMSHLNTLELLSQQILRLLEFERIYVQVGAEDLTPVSVEQSIAEAASLFSDLKGAELFNDCRGLFVLADSLLRQLFYNLIDNSLRYGEKVTNIRVKFEEQENCLKLIYEDNGVGLPDEIRGNLFREGFGKNTGYGLYLIKRICEAYGWTIHETGKQDEGAQFTMTIPKTCKGGNESYTLD